jgi:DNA invertase Pin-like site-specific DNA recombinase
MPLDIDQGQAALERSTAGQLADRFEREIIGERTRDKIAGTKRKGKWAGFCTLAVYCSPIIRRGRVVQTLPGSGRPGCRRSDQLLAM